MRENNKMQTKEQLSRMIDHTNLRMDATHADIERLCQEALDYHFGAVCVREFKVPVAYQILQGKGIHIASVVGFPTQKTKTVEEMIANLSQYSAYINCTETEYAIRKGADEIDMVINLAALKRWDYNAVEKDIKEVVKTAGSAEKPAIVKVIIETGYLTEEEKNEACRISENAGVHYVKTSTGYGTSGATLSDIELMGKITPEFMGIKASGGINTLDFMQQLYDASQKYKPHPFRAGASKLVEEFRASKQP